METLAWSDAQLIPARSSAALQLRGAKSQRQPGAKEFAVVRSMVAYQLLAKTKVAAGPSDSCLGVDLGAFQRLFSHVRDLPGFRGIKLTRCAWKRSGANADFGPNGPMEQTLLRGRWASVRTAKLYVHGAVAEPQRGRCQHLAARLRAAASQKQLHALALSALPPSSILERVSDSEERCDESGRRTAFRQCQTARGPW